MCGRYAIVTPTKALAEYFGVFPPKDIFMPTADARPMQNLPIILADEPRQMVIGHWGYPIKVGGKEKELINIRAENIVGKPYFRQVAEKHRCIILADGFFEWKRVGGRAQKYKFTLAKGPMAFAGIYEWKVKQLSDEIRPFFSIITTTPNVVVAPIHDRMPVILPTGNEKGWITTPFSADLLQSYAGKLDVSQVPGN